jgi:hypothetical protein
MIEKASSYEIVLRSAETISLPVSCNLVVKIKIYNEHIKFSKVYGSWDLVIGTSDMTDSNNIEVIREREEQLLVVTIYGEGLSCQIADSGKRISADHHSVEAQQTIATIDLYL